MTRIAKQIFRCTFPDYDESGIVYKIDAYNPEQAAGYATAKWEEDADDYRVLRAEDTLRIKVKQGPETTWWEVLGVQGRYVAKQHDGPWEPDQ